MILNVTEITKNYTRGGRPIVRFTVSFLEKNNEEPVVEVIGCLYSVDRTVMPPRTYLKSGRSFPNVKMSKKVLETLKIFLDNNKDVQICLGPQEEKTKVSVLDKVLDKSVSLEV